MYHREAANQEILEEPRDGQNVYDEEFPPLNASGISSTNVSR
ncbi:unnamed protein product, partial [Rotaria sp. Silwood2]